GVDVAEDGERLLALALAAVAQPLERTHPRRQRLERGLPERVQLVSVAAGEGAQTGIDRGLESARRPERLFEFGDHRAPERDQPVVDGGLRRRQSLDRRARRGLESTGV